MSAFYSSCLTSGLVSISYYEKYDNLREIRRGNLNVYSSRSLINYFYNLDLNSSSSTIAESILGRLKQCSNETKCLEKVAYNNSVYFVNKLEMSYFLRQERVTFKELINCSQGCIYKFVLIMYVRKDFPLLSAVNRIIGRVISSGLIIK